jgi:hypothetical protein
MDGWNSHDKFSSVFVINESCSFHKNTFKITWQSYFNSIFETSMHFFVS